MLKIDFVTVAEQKVIKMEGKVTEEVQEIFKRGIKCVLVIKEGTEEEVFNFGKKYGKSLGNPYFYLNDELLLMTQCSWYKELCRKTVQYEREQRVPTNQELRELNSYQIYVLGRLCWCI